MPSPRLLTPRNMVILSVISVAGGYFTLKPRALADQQRVRSSGDFAVSVDRSGGGV
ncbi:uncharacterized protein SETTUDRAFT_28275 [Exserohilum turcica Et28A]|uniref:Uncharacterized protein n=1 Tax=Exserohilum turcicum (strain 28A) TaxID=671987 RepID=R0K3J1_EXST2|nr:uncharacterized protein SETTUDRAFT_28275 [Exserohilum turcica Et28A]EOA87633.1 hypothetical protein SETTUDRAFT_28275 [Exserohilum turcica Et28A]